MIKKVYRKPHNTKTTCFNERKVCSIYAKVILSFVYLPTLLSIVGPLQSICEAKKKAPLIIFILFSPIFFIPLAQNPQCQLPRRSLQQLAPPTSGSSWMLTASMGTDRSSTGRWSTARSLAPCTTCSQWTRPPTRSATWTRTLSTRSASCSPDLWMEEPEPPGLHSGPGLNVLVGEKYKFYFVVWLRVELQFKPQNGNTTLHATEQYTL